MFSTTHMASGAPIASGRTATLRSTIENLTGSSFNDTLGGKSGTNILTGGDGGDVLTGGGGNDSFIFSALSHSLPTAVDLITDLNLGDRLDFRNLDADINTAGIQHLAEVAAFTGHAGEYMLSYDLGANQSSFAADADGDAVADMLIRFTGDVTALDSGWLFV